MSAILMGHYAEYSSNSLPTFRDNLSVVSNFVSSFYWIKYFLTSHVIGHRRGCQNTHALFHGHFRRPFLVLGTKSPVNISVHSNTSALKRNSGVLVLSSVEQWLSVNVNRVQPTI